MLKLRDHLACYDLANVTARKELLFADERQLTAIPLQPEGSGRN